jgi:transposase
VIQGDEWFMIRQLFREGLTISQIARRTGRDRKTVRRALRTQEQPAYKQRPATASKLDPYKDYVMERMDAGMTNAVKMYREISARGYDGELTILRQFMRPLRAAAEQKAVMRFETAPAQQAQVDWASCGQGLCQGLYRAVYCFIMTLAFSRMTYIEFTWRADTRAFIRGHKNAFSYFGGITQTCLYDNLKSVNLAYVDGGPRLNPTFADFADTFSFRPTLCRPYRPQTKGKVESGVGYVKGNFLLGDTFESLEELNACARGWLDSVANERVHGTTGEVPRRRFEREQPLLTPLRPGMSFDTALYEPRRITRDCLVSYRGSRYSVPHHYADRQAVIRDPEDGTFEVMVSGHAIARHELSKEKGKNIIVPAHYRGIAKAPIRRLARPPLVIAPPALPVEARPLSVYESLVEVTG